MAETILALGDVHTYIQQHHILQGMSLNVTSILYVDTNIGIIFKMGEASETLNMNLWGELKPSRSTTSCRQMARRKPLHKYPQEMYLLFEQAQRAELVMEFDSPGQAKSFRVELYNLRSQVRQSVAFDPTVSELAEHLLLMDNIVINREGNKLILKKRQTPYLEVMEKALGQHRTADETP